MCFKTPKIDPKPIPPKRDDETKMIRDARLRTARAQGSSANIFTSALGDSGFGSSIQGATRLG